MSSCLAQLCSRVFNVYCLLGRNPRGLKPGNTLIHLTQGRSDGVSIRQDRLLLSSFCLLKTGALLWLILAGYLIISLSKSTITKLVRYGNIIVQNVTTRLEKKQTRKHSGQRRSGRPAHRQFSYLASRPNTKKPNLSNVEAW